MHYHSTGALSIPQSLWNMGLGLINEVNNGLQSLVPRPPRGRPSPPPGSAIASGSGTAVASGYNNQLAQPTAPVSAPYYTSTGPHPIYLKN